MKISDLIPTLITEIQEEANRIAEASRTETTDGESRTIILSDPNLNLERLIQQAQADAEIAGYCTTDKSRKDRRAALVRAGACTLLALFEMDREKMQRLLASALRHLRVIQAESSTETIPEHPRDCG